MHNAAEWPGIANFGFAILCPRDGTLSPENVLTTADLLPVLAAPTLGLVIKGALEAFFSLQLQCMKAG